MADDQFNEDAALHYVLGELTDAEQREFESRLATSADLRARVNELESGAVAAATAAPRRRPPVEVWQRIEKAVAKEARPKLAFPIFRFGWLRSGWAVALVCLIGWLFYAFSANRHLASVAEKLKISQHEIAVVNSHEPATKPIATKPAVSNATNVAFELLQSRTQEIMELRGKIAQLETETTQLSRSLAQQQALLGESNRIKFYHLAPTSTAGGNASPAPLSPGLQHAVLMALARNLGWLPTDSSSAPQTGGNFPLMPVNIGGVDFIDLRPGSQNVVSQPQTQTQNGSGQPAADNTANAQVQRQIQPQTESPAASPGTADSTPTIPAYVSGDNLVVALDSTIVPAGSSVTLTAYDANQNETGGSFTLGNDPAVITLPTIFGSSSFAPTYTTGLGIITMSFTSPDGQSSTIYFSQPFQPLNP